MNLTRRMLGNAAADALATPSRAASLALDLETFGDLTFDELNELDLLDLLEPYVEGSPSQHSRFSPPGLRESVEEQAFD